MLTKIKKPKWTNFTSKQKEYLYGFRYVDSIKSIYGNIYDIYLDSSLNMRMAYAGEHPTYQDVVYKKYEKIDNYSKLDDYLVYEDALKVREIIRKTNRNL